MSLFHASGHAHGSKVYERPTLDERLAVPADYGLYMQKFEALNPSPQSTNTSGDPFKNGLFTRTPGAPGILIGEAFEVAVFIGAVVVMVIGTLCFLFLLAWFGSCAPPSRPTAVQAPPATVSSYAGYSNQGYHNPNYSNPNYSNPNYGNPNYGNPNCSNPNYSNPNYSSPNYSSPNYSSPNFSSPNYSSPNFSNPNYGNPNYDPANPLPARVLAPPTGAATTSGGSPSSQTVWTYSNPYSVETRGVPSR
jgi:hypothetical protein